MSPFKIKADSCTELRRREALELKLEKCFRHSVYSDGGNVAGVLDQRDARINELKYITIVASVAW